MKLIFLGTGAAVPSKNRNHIGIAFKFGGEVFLFDCGENIQRQMLFTEVSPMKINHIFITHLHGDHILGIPGLLQSMGFFGRDKEINIFGPEGTKEVVENSLKLGAHYIEFPIKVYEIYEKKPITIYKEENYEIIAYPTEHGIPSYAYIFKERKKPRLDIEKAKKLGVKIGPDLKKLKNGEAVKNIYGEIVNPEDVLLPPKKGFCLAYSGDTVPLEDFGKYLNELGCDILIHEATFDDSSKDIAKDNMHSTIGDAVNIAKLANVKALILTHISARYDKEEYFNLYKMNVKQYNESFKIIISEDLMTYDIKRDLLG
ncbi:ribonuclease Z [Methanocaldococcus bathoardescens]|uniref:Ribonuclease Z n=1 Tax=Methanocaldococcus bathoardescens TaxID=1301915 RepID=A0A076LA29_9EURY|nr:ribonuclease Z [Methanocaldococcus bathoardescens]AIJ05205.1 ribonuclease Z [Methanocaldococcus bathoardescens]